MRMMGAYAFEFANLTDAPGASPATDPGLLLSAGAKPGVPTTLAGVGVAAALSRAPADKLSKLSGAWG